MPPINFSGVQAREPLASPYAQDFRDQLTQLQATAPTEVRTPGALASNLLADALLQWGGDRRKPGPAAMAGPPTTPPASSASYGFWPSLDARMQSYRFLPGQAGQPAGAPGLYAAQAGANPGSYNPSSSTP